MREKTVLPALREKLRAPRQYSYLLHFIFSCVALFLVPCLIAMTIMFQRSFNEIRRSNEQSQVEQAELFAKCFVDALSDLQKNALEVSVGTRDSLSPYYELQPARLEEHPFYYYSFMNVIRQCGEPTFGLYYAKNDCLITRDGKYTAYSYSRYYLNLRAEAARKKFITFLSEAPGVQLGFCPLYGVNAANCLFISVPVRLGLSHEPALLFYQLDESSFKTNFVFSSGQKDAQFAVVDPDTRAIIYTIGPSFVSQFDADREIGQSSMEIMEIDGEPYCVVAARENDLGYVYVSIQPQATLMAGMYEFYSTALGILIAFCAVLLVLTILMVYVNYHPIYRLVRKLGGDRAEGELATISNTFEKINNEKSELNMMVVDLLLGNLLYGHPVTENDLLKLGLSPRQSGRFGVLTLSPQRLNTNDRLALTGEVFDPLGITCYITDIPGRDHTLMVCLLADADNSALLERLNAFLTQRFQAPYDLRVGRIVSAINEINLSYADCLDAPPETGDPQDPALSEEKRARSSLEKLKDEVLSYLQMNFCDTALSQSAVADHFGISVYTLSRLFKNHVGLGFSEYITGKRLDYAKDLLLTTTLSVNEIAQRVGIPNSGYFSRLFKLNFGVTPLKYRAERGNLILKDY